jgi:predicted amidohydrolase YtcJ
MRFPGRYLALAVALVAVCPVSGQEQPWTPHADTILMNGGIVTVDREFSIKQALAIKDGRIIATGSSAEVGAHRGPRTRVIDLQGRTVLPGLQDSHIHFRELGHQVTHDADFSLAKNAEEIVQSIRALIERRKLPAGEMVRGHRWDQYRYPQPFTRWQLDAVTPNNPARLDRTYRGVAVNTRYFERMGIHDNEPETWPAWWQNDPADFTLEDKIIRAERTLVIQGKKRQVKLPTGMFLGMKAAALVQPEREQTIDDFEADVESVKLGSQEMLSLGVTSLIDPASEMGYNMKVYQEAYNRGWLTLRISAVYEGIFFTQSPEIIRRHFEGIKINNLGDHFLRWRGVKFYGDGGVGSRSAWLSEPFEHSREMEGKDNYGVPVQPDYAAREAQYRAVLEYGWDLHTHSTGDQAMRETMDLYKKLLDEIHARRPGIDPRWSIIHAYLPLEAKTRVLEDMAKYHIVALLNPIFHWMNGIDYQHNLGAERMARFNPARSYMKAGVTVASGSDFAVATHDPWLGLYALVVRKDDTTGKVDGPEERLDFADALRTYTINGAYLTYEDNFKGTLEPGKVADLVVLDIRDIKDIDRNPEILKSMRKRVLMSMVEGQVRYQQPGSTLRQTQ